TPVGLRIAHRSHRHRGRGRDAPPDREADDGHPDPMVVAAPGSAIGGKCCRSPDLIGAARSRLMRSAATSGMNYLFGHDPGRKGRPPVVSRMPIRHSFAANSIPTEAEYAVVSYI